METMQWRQLPILVTGGAGFIGSEVVRQLAWRGHRVVVLDNLINGKRENLAEVAGKKNVTIVVADLRDTEAVRRALEGIEVVYHLACLGVRHSIHSPKENHEVNATATLQLLTLARAAKVERFVYVSSSEIYGTARWVPMTEDYPPFPKTVYGASKLAGDCYARAFYDTYGFPTTVVRPFNSYGPNCHHEGDSGEVIPKFLLRCMAGKPMVIFGDGAQTRDFTYVSDTAAGIILAGREDAAIGETINLGCGAEIQIKGLAEEVARACGVAHPRIEYAEPRPGDVLRLCADPAKSRRVLGFKPAVPLAEGLQKLREWYAGLKTSPEELLQTEVVRNWEAPAGRSS